ncbi:MAG: PQQ-binding-like beta-propeller repeat protein [Pirellulales bacterium]|jgi:outer membrane protein assembly factor BamB|nr:PQQ-binding-like beta-propeller repeat protein [Pirellulales bacterium]
MKCYICRTVMTLGLLVSVLGSSLIWAADWPQWRGVGQNNHAALGATAPLEWKGKEGFAWVTPVPGRGHSSPTVVGNRIYLTTADTSDETQSLLIYDCNTGEELGRTIVLRGGLPEKIHLKNTHATPTASCDGERVYVVFHNDGAIWATALDLDGQKLWQQRVTAFQPKKYEFGYAPSPVLCGNLLIVAAEYDGPESGIYAIDTATGERRWKATRPQGLSFSTPIPLGDRQKPQLLVSGNKKIAAYDFQDGVEVWSIEGSTQATCGTMVWDRKLRLAFASGGYPDKFTVAIQMDGDHQVVWENQVCCYEQSLLLDEGYLYAVADSGVAYCWRASDGEEMWKHRLGGKYSSSPLLVDGRIYVSNEAGTTFVIEATPDRFNLLAENQLGTEVFATPTPADGRLYYRFAEGTDENRQEFLVAIGP